MRPISAKPPFDHSGYRTIRDIDTLERWIADAREAGLVGFDTQATSPDAMRADLVGFSLAVADYANDPSGSRIRAAYVPLAHKSGVSDLLGGDLSTARFRAGRP